MSYFVYSLEHIYIDDTHCDCKFLGYFDDLDELEEVKERMMLLPGFSQYPNDFYIKKIELNKINWQNGFKEIVGEIGRDYLPEKDCVSECSKMVKKLGGEIGF